MTASSETPGQTGGVDISGSIGSVAGDLVGGNKGLDEEKLVAVLEARGVIQSAEMAGLQPDRQTIIGASGGVTAGKIEGGTYNLNGLSEADRALMKQQHMEVIAAITRDKGVPHATLQTLLVRMGEGRVPVEEVETRLLAKVDDYVSIKVELTRQSVNRPDAAATMARTQMLLDQGDFEGARAVLAEERGRLRAQREQRAREAADLTASEALIAYFALRSSDAAALFEEAATLVKFDQEAAWKHTMAAASALYDQGNEFGDNTALQRAIDTCEKALALAPHAKRPLDWAHTQVTLGTALQRLGAREIDIARLERSVEAFKAALQEITREREPLQWANTQVNFGVALRSLGEREAGTARLERSVEAFKAVLQEITREREPLQWANTQLNFGATLWELGNREVTLGAEEAGIASLEQAVEAFMNARREFQRKKRSFNAARAQMNLGTVLVSLGKREAGTERLRLSVAAFNGVLRTFTQERLPLEWARAQANLGSALWWLGTRYVGPLGVEEPGLPLFEQAVKAFKDALKEMTRQRLPLEWANTQKNLGMTLTILGSVMNRTARLEEAVTAFDACLTVIATAGPEEMAKKVRDTRDRVSAQISTSVGR